MYRRSFFVQGIILASIVTVSVAVAAFSWQKEDPSQWTSDEVYQILNNSPWSKSVRVNVLSGPRYGAENPSGGGSGGTWGEGIPGGGMGGGGGGLGRGRAGGYPRGEQDPTVTVQVASALPVRLAAAKSSGGGADAAAMKPLNEIVIAVVGLPKSGLSEEPMGGSDSDSDDASLAAHLKVITVFSVGHERLNPTKIELNQGRDGRAIFHFERPASLSVHDKEADFRITGYRMEIRKKFALKDMEYQGKLEI